VHTALVDTDVASYREVCLRCRRPKSVCWCSAVTQVPSQTRVVFIQHPKEAKVPISTCRMAHLSLPNSELHVGLSAVGNPALEALCARPGVAVLFPSESATDVEELAAPPHTLVVVDGTWSNAKKVVEKCPLLSKLPRLKFFPRKPGNYRIRKEPEAHCLATIEAAAFVLERLEKADDRFTPILTAFDAMVERQLSYIQVNQASRHAGRKRRNSVPFDPVSAIRGRELVVVFGEANAWPRDDVSRPLPDEPELVQLVAERIFTGERFTRLLRPARPLGPRVAAHLDVEARTILEADGRAEVLEAWKAFAREGELYLGWGGFCRDLLATEGASPKEFLNLRSVVSAQARAPSGSVESIATGWGAVLPEGQGRAMRRLEALAFVTRRLVGDPRKIPTRVTQPAASAGQFEAGRLP
jgi:DTW domain-containing protein